MYELSLSDSLKTEHYEAPFFFSQWNIQSEICFWSLFVYSFKFWIITYIRGDTEKLQLELNGPFSAITVGSKHFLLKQDFLALFSINLQCAIFHACGDLFFPGWLHSMHLIHEIDKFEKIQLVLVVQKYSTKFPPCVVFFHMIIITVIKNIK